MGHGADIERGLSEMLLRDNALLRDAGCDMAEASLRVVRTYDGVHRLSLAVAGWCRAMANQGWRGGPSDAELLTQAREAAAADDIHNSATAAAFLAGEFDDGPIVQAALRALRRARGVREAGAADHG